MHEVEPYQTYVFLGVLCAMVITLAIEERIHAKKSMITGVYAAISLLLGSVFGFLPTRIAAGQVELPVYIPAIEWEVVAIILGSSLFIDVVARSGIFSWTAIKLTKLSSGDPLKLLIYYSLLTVVFSAVLNNVTAMIIVGSLTSVSLAKLDKKDLMLGFLLTLGLLTNIGGLLTLISSVPNIILGNAAEISFVRFFLVAGPYVALATVVTVVLAVKLFGIRSLKTAEEKQAAAELVASFDETDGIESRAFYNISWLLLISFIVCIATTSVLPYVQDLGMGYVAMTFGIIALLRYKHEVDKNYSAIDWDLLAFFVYLFVVINTMEYAGVLHLMGDGIAYLIAFGQQGGAAALIWSTALASSVTDNVPLAAVMANILGAGGDAIGDFHWWATIFGTNLGGNFTPIGSASTVVAVALIHKNGIRLSFVGFVVKALPFALAHIVLATGYVLLFLR